MKKYLGKFTIFDYKCKTVKSLKSWKGRREKLVLAYFML